MLKSIIRRAVMNAFSEEDLLEALTLEVADLIDYESLAQKLLADYNYDDLVEKAAEECALDLFTVS